MALRKPSKVVAFRYVGTSPVVIHGLGELKEGDTIAVDKAKELFGEDFNGSILLVPVEENEVGEPQGGDN